MKYFRRLAGLGVLTSCCYSTIYFSKTCVSVDELAKKIQTTENNSPVVVPDKVKKLMNDALLAMKLKEEEKSLIKTIIVDGMELDSFGTSRHSPGAYIAIPRSFYYDGKKPITYFVPDVKEADIKELSEKLKTALSTSDKAKKFALAHAAYETKSILYYILGTYPILISTAFFLSLQRKVLNDKKPTPNKLLFTVCFIITIAFTYLFFYSFFEVLRSFSADYYASQLGKEYTEGGIEYYEKLKERNKIIKFVNENASFTDGDDHSLDLLKLCKLPLSVRIELLKDTLKAIENNEKPPSYWEQLMKI